jgi:tetratricopeptide (TPR) repeat protein
MLSKKIDALGRRLQEEQQRQCVSSPEEEHQYVVSTPYGVGLVLRTRKCDGIKEIQIGWSEEEVEGKTNASNINGRHRGSMSTAMNMLYTPIDYPSVVPNIGDDVICNYGRGRVMQIVEIKVDDNDDYVTQQNDTTTTSKKKYTIALSKWRLNGGRKSVICYVTTSSSNTKNTTTSMLHVVRKYTVNEMSIPERIELANQHKTNASKQFTSKKYDIALQTYAAAVSIARDRQHDPTTNELRADLVVLMITCSNNAATCCIKLNQYTEAKKHSQNALILCDALYTKRNMKVHTVLRNDGISDAKIFGEWRIKSYIIISHCALVDNKGGIQEYDVIVGILKKAHGIAIEYINELNTAAAAAATTLMNSTIESNKTTKLLVEEHTSSIKSLTLQTKEIRRLLVECNSKKKTMKDIEKRRAKAMFASSSVSESKMNNDCTGTTTEDEKKEEGKIWHPLMEDTTSQIKETKSVTFSSRPPQVKEITPQSSVMGGDDDDDDDDREGNYDDDTSPWFVEHREALLVLAITGFTAIAVLAFRTRRSS